VQGSLFQNGVAYTDISQGAVGDCYFMAALGSVALRNPSMIESMFIDNGDNTFTVRFFDDASTAQYVTVDRFLPTIDAAGDRLYASFGTDNDNATNELWVALAEKAYAQINDSGWISQDGTNSYEGIDSGWPADSMAHITGLETFQSPMQELFSIIDVSPKFQPTSLSSAQVIEKINAGKLLAVDSNENPVKSTVVGNHAYTVVGYNAATGKFTLFNPWGLDRSAGSLTAKPATLDLTWSEIVTNFRMWDYT
jgi:Calpain family cysteine protease